jgi:hypothetical protein
LGPRARAGEFADLENMTAEQLADFIRTQAEESLH